MRFLPLRLSWGFLTRNDRANMAHAAAAALLLPPPIPNRSRVTSLDDEPRTEMEGRRKLVVS